MELKRYSHCGNLRLMSEFKKESNECLICRRNYTAEWRLRNKERLSEYSRCRQKDKVKRVAQNAINHAIRDGKLQKGITCEYADQTCCGRIEAHHHNGYDPKHKLDVVWVCRRHHRLLHNRAEMSVHS